MSRTIAGNAPVPAVGLVIDTTFSMLGVPLTESASFTGLLAVTHHQRPLPGTSW